MCLEIPRSRTLYHFTRRQASKSGAIGFIPKHTIANSLLRDVGASLDRDVEEAVLQLWATASWYFLSEVHDRLSLTREPIGLC